MARIAHLLLALVVLVAPLRIAPPACDCPEGCRHHVSRRLPCHGAKKAPCHDGGAAWRPIGCGHAGDIAGVHHEPALLVVAAALVRPLPIATRATPVGEAAPEGHVRVPERPPRSFLVA